MASSGSMHILSSQTLYTCKHVYAVHILFEKPARMLNYYLDKLNDSFSILP